MLDFITSTLAKIICFFTNQVYALGFTWTSFYVLAITVFALVCISDRCFNSFHQIFTFSCDFAVIGNRKRDISLILGYFAAELALIGIFAFLLAKISFAVFSDLTFALFIPLLIIALPIGLLIAEMSRFEYRFKERYPAAT